MDRVGHLAGRSVLREVREHEHAAREPQDDAVLVHGLPELFQRQDGHPARQFQHPAAQVGNRHLPVPDELEVRLVDETAPRSEDQSEVRMVHAASHPRGVDAEGGRREALRRPGRGRRDLHGREAEEHAERQAQGTGGDRPRRGWQDGGCWRERPGDESGIGPRRREHRQADPAGVRGRGIRLPARPSTATRRQPTRGSPSTTNQ